MHLNLITTFNNGTLCITVGSPRLDAALAEEFKAGVEAAWAVGVARVEINLGAVEFMDSSGVGVLINVVRRLPPRRGLTRLTHVRPGVWALLELLHLRPLFDPTFDSTPPDRAAAIQPLGA